MPTIRFEVESLQGERLDRAVADHARRAGFDVSNRKAKQLVEDGAVRVDGREAWKASQNLRRGQLVVAKIPDEWVDATEPQRVDIAERIVHRDEWLVAIDKPAGLPTHATHDPDRDHARGAVMRWLAAQGVDEPYVAVHHRLDVDTTGVLLFGVHRDANKGLADAFAERTAEKKYAALVHDHEMPERFETKNHLDFDRRQGRVCEVHSGGDFAHTGFERIARAGGVALVRAALHTGRRHQIRAHLAQAGQPILGDTLYGGPVTLASRSFPRVMLHAERLALPHPVTGEVLELSAPLPADMVAVLAAFEIEIADVVDEVPGG